MSRQRNKLQRVSVTDIYNTTQLASIFVLHTWSFLGNLIPRHSVPHALPITVPALHSRHYIAQPAGRAALRAEAQGARAGQGSSTWPAAVRAHVPSELARATIMVQIHQTLFPHERQSVGTRLHMDSYKAAITIYPCTLLSGDSYK